MKYISYTNDKIFNTALSFTNDHVTIGRRVHDVSVGRMTKKKKIHVVKLSLLQGTQFVKIMVFLANQAYGNNITAK